MYTIDLNGMWISEIVRQEQNRNTIHNVMNRIGMVHIVVYFKEKEMAYTTPTFKQ